MRCCRSHADVLSIAQGAPADAPAGGDAGSEGQETGAGPEINIKLRLNTGKEIAWKGSQSSKVRGLFVSSLKW